MIIECYFEVSGQIAPFSSRNQVFQILDGCRCKGSWYREVLRLTILHRLIKSYSVISSTSTCSLVLLDLKKQVATNIPLIALLIESLESFP
jgi:hypothetical protein